MSPSIGQVHDTLLISPKVHFGAGLYTSCEHQGDCQHHRK
jgi:hypothetical protein